MPRQNDIIKSCSISFSNSWDSLVDAEVRSATGRADAVVKTPKYIYVFEFKLDGSTEQALQQIDDRGYLIPYTADSRQLVKVGVNFNAEKRNIGEWKIKNE